MAVDDVVIFLRKNDGTILITPKVEDAEEPFCELSHSAMVTATKNNFCPECGWKIR